MGKGTVPPYPASNIQDAWFLPAAKTLADKGLLFGAQVKEITARTIHSGAADNPHVEFNVAIRLTQLFKHCLSKGTHKTCLIRFLISRYLCASSLNTMS